MERDTLRLFAKCCRKAKQSENRWPRLSRTRFHRSHHTSLPFISVYSAIAARAYYTPRLASLYFSYALYSLFVLLNARDQSFPFLLYHVLFLTAEVPPSRSPSAHRIYSDFLTCSTLSILSHRQFHRVPSSISIAHVLRLCSFTIPSFPPPFLCNDAFISPYPHRYYVARVFVPANRARRLFLFRTIRPDASRPPVSMPRTEVALLSVPLHSSLFVNSRSSSHHVAPRLCPSFPNVPMSVRLFDYVSPAFPYLATYLRARHWLMADSDCPFPLRRSSSCRSLCALFYCSD